MSTIRLSHPTKSISGNIRLDGSKSISNRALIIQALCPNDFELHRLSSSDDTRVLQKLLQAHPTDVYDVHHAGTSFRFLTAYLALQSGTQLLTGSERMQQRPIGPLVDALREIGADITYVNQEGYPPLRIGEPKFTSDTVEIDATVSSQYITALILIAPVLPNGLTIRLRGNLVSAPYLKMTLKMIEEFGINYTWVDNDISIPAQNYMPRDYTIEADWSASSYHFAIAALADDAEITLEGLFPVSTQGDSAMIRIGNILGVESEWQDEKLLIKKTSRKVIRMEYDFIEQPDLAQTIAVWCAARGINNEFSGLQTLRIKETDRIAAVDNELSKIGSSFRLTKEQDGEEYYSVQAGVHFTRCPQFDTYKDHRMAMAFAPLALIHPIEIHKPEVVSKSYPAFWEDLKKLGFVIEEMG